jgi:cellulose synthase/poly-beta-1,6-N-acetylglucosamine synthase-like glycosyltransferase
MLSALLLAGLFVAPISTGALFLRRVSFRRAEGIARYLGRLLWTLLVTLLLAAVVAGILHLIGATTDNTYAAAAAIIAVSLFWMPVTRRWTARAHLCWSSTTFLFGIYLVFMLWWTFISHLGAGGTLGGVILWCLELLAAFLGCAYLWELCDALGRASWTRRVVDGAPVEELSGPLPFVSLHVPAHNEPPDLVIETLKSLSALDYPNYEVIVLDDNSEDESMWRPVEDWCRNNGTKYVHLENWPGFKSGALNYALANMIDERTALIGVVDSDYQIEPDFLRRCAPLFNDPGVGFIQAPQDYRDWEHAPFYRRLYYSYRYFFAVSQPSRNERDGAIFAGTMGLIRRRALEEAGGWDEWCITEDAELSLRLLRNGWTGLHVDRSFGKGIMPLTFEALKSQRFRWCFGGIQILRRNWRFLLPGRRTEQNRLTLGQRWAYLSGAVQWYGDLLALLFFAFLLVGSGNIAFGAGFLFRKLTGFLIAAIPFLVILGLVRAVALLRRGTGASWSDAIGAFLIWQSTAFVTARASVQALFAKQAEFLRTPKTAEDRTFFDAVRLNGPESLFALLGLAGIAGALARPSGYGGPLTAALLVWPTASFAAAPWNSLAARRAALPPQLAARRRTEYARYGGARRATFALGGLAATGALAALAIALVTSGPSRVVPPQVVGPAQGHPAHYGSAPPRRRHGTPTTSTTTPTSTTLPGNTGTTGATGTTGTTGATGTTGTSGNTGTTTTPSSTSSTTTSTTTSTTPPNSTTTTSSTTTTTTTIP